MQPVKLYVSQNGRQTVGDLHAVALEQPIALHCGERMLRLSVRLNYLIVARPTERRAQRYKISTQRYQHGISDEATSAEIIAWHWHPGDATPPAPHIHVTGREGSPITRRGHVPSGRVSVEAVVRYALSELQCKANRADWVDVLDRCEQDFRTFASWGARRPQ